MMQNHYVISSKYHFWTRNVPNWTKTLTSVMSGPVQENRYLLQTLFSEAVLQMLAVLHLMYASVPACVTSLVWLRSSRVWRRSTGAWATSKRYSFWAGELNSMEKAVKRSSCRMLRGVMLIKGSYVDQGELCWSRGVKRQCSKGSYADSQYA